MRYGVEQDVRVRGADGGQEWESRVEKEARGCTMLHT
jgi:hypothetical protein